MLGFSDLPGAQEVLEARLRRLHRIALLSIAVVGTITVLGGIALERTTGWVQHTREMLRMVRELQARLFEHESVALQGGPIVPQPEAESVIPAASPPLAVDLLAVIDTMQALTSDNPQQHRRVETIADAVVNWNGAMRRIVLGESNREALEAKRVLQLRIAEFQDEEQRLYDARTANARGLRFAVLASILVALAIIWYVLTRFVRSTVREAHVARDAIRARDRTAERLGVITDISPNAFAIVGVDDRLVLANAAWRALEHFDAPDAQWMSRLDPALGDVLRLLLEQVRTTHETRREELIDPSAMTEVAGQSVKRVWMVTAYRVARGADLDGSICLMLQDVTSLRAMEHQMRQSQRLEAIGRLAGGVAHDFNNTLTAIIGFTDMALAEARERGRLREDLQQARRAADRAALLTRQLLSFSRQPVLQPRVYGLGDIVRNLELMIRRLIGSHIQVEVRIAPDTGSVEADAGRIEQLVLNLIINARDAMEYGGELTVEMNNASTADLQAAHDRGDLPASALRERFALIRVRDTGSGMTPEVRRQIFEPFFTTKPVGQGTGLGLSTALQVVREANGYIGVQTAPGVGTVFEVYLPLVEAEAVPVEATPVLNSPQRRSGTVLVVEDDRDVRQLTEYVLSEAGYSVHVAKNGLDAIEVLRRRGDEIDLIITDLVMPGLGGVDLSRHELVTTWGIRVLFLTGYGMNSSLRMAVLPFDAHVLTKPFSPSQLLDAVAETDPDLIRL